VTKHARDVVGQCLRVSPSIAVPTLGDAVEFVSGLEAAVRIMEQRATASVWRTRQATLQLVTQFRARHLFALPASLDDRLLDIACGRLKDSQNEVQDAASATLVGFMMTLSEAKQVELAEPFKALVSTKVPKKPNAADRAAAEGDSVKQAELDKRLKKHTSRLKKRHAGVLGLGALVLAHPYDIPSFLPDALILLSRCNADPVPVSTTVRHVFTQFKRTHHDNWEEHKRHFSPEQLTDLVDLLVSPTYYA